MAIDIIYQKRDFGETEKHSQRAIFVDEKHLEEIEARVEFKLGSVLKEIQEFISKFDRLSRELNLGNEIQTATDFFNAKYLQQPDYNFHEKALQLRKLLNILLSNFLSDTLVIIKKLKKADRNRKQFENRQIYKMRYLL